MKDEGKPLLLFFNSLSEVTLRITKIVIKFAPIGILFLVMPRVISVEDVRASLASVGYFTLTVLLGLFIHGLIVLPLIYYIITRKNPYVFLAKMTEAMMTAFGTSSSLATLPVTITCLEDNNKINRNVVRFCVPIGATINMDGTALYEAVAAIFIAQVNILTFIYLNVKNIILITTYLYSPED
jgi:solute carrier family 1 (high affinity glutamate transporter) protein 3